MRVEDKSRLTMLDRQKNIFYYAKIVILDRNEDPIQTIEGKVLPGSSISINGSSNIRRTCNITLIADEKENDLTDVDNLLSINKKIKIYTGIHQNIDWDKDIIYYDTETPLLDPDPNIVVRPSKGENGKIYINRSNTVYLTKVTIDGVTKKVFNRKQHSDFPAYYWDESAHIYKKLDSIYDYESIIFWFAMGVYVITQPSLTHNSNGCQIALTCQDKMCLLNGSMGGNLPASVCFDVYDQEIGHVYLDDGETELPPIDDPNDYNAYHYNSKIFMYDKKYGWSEVEAAEIPSKKEVRTLIYDIIQTLVINYGEELMTKIIINDIPKEIKQIVRYLGSAPLYYNRTTGVFTFEGSRTTEPGVWQIFNYNDEIGYTWVDFTYPESNKGGAALLTSIGDNVCTVLDKIVQLLGNYEYFYDVDGNFVFQEIKNYLNNSYNVMKNNNNMLPYYIDSNKNQHIAEIKNNNIKLIGAENYQADYFGDQSSVYTFTEDNELISAYTNNPDYTNVKNDFHIWGKSQDGKVIHYHIAIKEIPKKEYIEELGDYGYPLHEVVFRRDSEKHFDGRIRMLQKEDFIGVYANIVGTDLNCKDHTVTYVEDGVLYIMQDSSQIKTGIDVKQNIGLDTAKLSLQTDGEVRKIRANDWRAEIYLQGLEKIHSGDRPDKYEQELLDFFDTIYEWGYYDTDDQVKRDEDFVFEGRFKTDITSTPNELTYFIDYLEPVDRLYGMSVDDIGSKIYSYQQDKIVKMYNDEVPDIILIDYGWSQEYQDQIRLDCNEQGQQYVNIEDSLYKSLAANVLNYTAQETVRNFLYQYTTYNESITLQTMPIYYLDVNQRITVQNNKTGIYGDYIIKNLTVPLVPNGAMTITAVKAINRI